MLALRNKREATGLARWWGHKDTIEKIKFEIIKTIISLTRSELSMVDKPSENLLKSFKQVLSMVLVVLDNDFENKSREELLKEIL